MEQSKTNHYLSESAGQLMITHVPTVRPDENVADFEAKLKKHIAGFETINYAYVIDRHDHLIGVITLKEVFRQPSDKRIDKIMKREIISARVHTDQERVAQLALKHNLKAIPIVDKDNKFLGVIPSDVILGILNREAKEDLLRFGGIYQAHKPAAFDNVFEIPLFALLKHRLPWLILGLFGGLLAAGIVRYFEEILSQNIILAAFIPLVVYMADAVGTQTGFYYP